MTEFVKRKLTRGDCLKEARPCRRHCPYRLEGPESCALDVADRGGVTHAEIGALMGMSRERVRQVEEQAIAKVCAALGRPVPELDDYAVDLEARRDTSERDAFDEDVFAAIAAADRVTAADLVASVGRGRDTLHTALVRLVEEGRVVRHRLPTRQLSYAYEAARGEAAE